MDKINAYATISSYSADNLRMAKRSSGPQTMSRSAEAVPDKPKEKIATRLPENITKQAFEATQQKPKEKPSAASTQAELYEPATRTKSKAADSESKYLGSTVNYMV